VRHLLIDQWSRRPGPLQALPAGPKLAALFVTLVSISLAPITIPAAILLLALIYSKLPPLALLKRAALVLPFAALLALADPARAATLLTKTYLSALAALLFAATTPLPAWTAALRHIGVPATLVSTIEFVYRYLFVLAEEARSIATAARARGGFRFTAAAGAIAVLFARSWHRAESVHRAMLARGYQVS
jgi:cobalt/nickel transport system permease protein